MDYGFGNYGFLQQGKMKNPPLVLLDLGVERRCREKYGYENINRSGYGGYLLQYTLNGCGIYESFGKKFCLTAGNGFFAKMPEDSRYYLDTSHTAAAGSSPDAEWEFFYPHFDGFAVYPFWETVRELSGPVFFVAPEKPPVRLFLQFFQKCREKRPAALYETGEFLYRFLACLTRELETPSLEGSTLVKQASCCLRERFSSLQGIGEVAQACHVSQEHLTRAFRAETGQTPLQYLTRLRMEHGLFLLLNTTDSIENIAAACGFLNGNYFAKVFRRYLHCSPEEYRKRNRY